MVFSSLIFICVFLPLTTACYFGLPRFANNLVLVIASVIFYGWGDPVALILIGISIAVNFQFGRLIEPARDIYRRRLIIAAIGVNLSILIIFKYAHFIADNVNILLGLVSWRQLPQPKISLPLGISFFTFHIMSYLIDVYRGTVTAQQSLSAFALYVINFPQLIAGPIIRYRLIAGQLISRRASLSDVNIGIARFTGGLAKKLLLADPFGEIANWVFMSPANDLSVPTAWAGVICYALQIYYDFSGYSDMAIGLGRIFGFHFPENFNYPYAATSMQDFWRRWHMTLSAWFRDYVYVPLGGSRFGKWTTVRNLWIVFLLVGAWHGASWNFIVWGAWHGLFLSIERFDQMRRLLLKSPKALQNIYVLAVVLVGWAFFRAPTLEGGVALLSRMFGFSAVNPEPLSIFNMISGQMLILLALAFCLAYPIWPRIKVYWQRWAERDGSIIFADLLRGAVLAGILVLSIATLAIERSHSFLYFRF